MKIFRYSLIIFSCLFIFSCGSRRLVSGEGAISEDATAASVINRHYAEEIEFSTLQARLRARYEDEGTTQNLTVSLRMEKDKIIWMSGSLLGFTVAKVMITPDRVRYYEKINGEYFDGDFKLLSNWLGVPLDFDKVQNLLIGQAIYDLRAEKFVSEESSRGYRLAPVQEDNILKRLFWLSPSNYKVMAEQISQPDQNRHLTITYPSYQRVEDRLVPNKIEVIANDASGSNRIDMEFSNVDFDAQLSFPFEVPAGYQEINIR